LTPSRVNSLTAALPIGTYFGMRGSTPLSSHRVRPPLTLTVQYARISVVRECARRSYAERPAQ
jgi:hypothetical protein